jgi:hypothetical protein
MWFLLDFGEPCEPGAIRFWLGKRPGDFPRQLKIEGSTDGRQWKTLGEGRPWLEVLRACFADPKNPSFEVMFSVTPCRYLRLTQTAKHFDYRWSIAEIRIMDLRGLGYDPCPPPYAMEWMMLPDER